LGRAGAILLVIAAIALPSLGSAQTDENGVIKYIDPPVPPGYGNRERFFSVQHPDFEEGEFARRDRMLLERYGSVAEIESLRDRRLDLLESQIKVTEVYLGKLYKRLGTLEAEASNFKPSSTREDAPPIPESLSIDMSRTTASIKAFEQTLERTRADHAALKKQFADDIARFIELKGA